MFEDQFVPFQTTSLLGTRVLVLAPHPDDESLGCGGSLIRHRRRGDPVKVVFLTDGAQGDNNDRLAQNDYVARREAEAQRACAILGVTDLAFWRLPDRGCRDDPPAVRRLSELLAEYRPALIYVTSPFEFHPDHRIAARLAWRAVRETLHDAQIAFYEVNRPFLINALIDISEQVEQKRRACNAYASQMANVPYTELALSVNRFRTLTVAASCSHAEGLFVVDARQVHAQPIESLLRRQYLRETSHPQQQVPLVSIIIRTRDRLPLLRQALASVAAQTYPHIEVVVVNDHGADVSAVVSDFREQLVIRQVSLPERRGRSAAANAGLAMAGGDLISFLDDDDLLHPDHVEKLAGYLVRSRARFAYSDCVQGNYAWDGSELALLVRSPFPVVPFDRERLHRDNYIPIMAAMFTRELLDEVGPLDEGLEMYEDWDLWIRMAERADFHHVPGVSAEYRIHKDDNLAGMPWRVRVYEKHRDRVTIDSIVRYAWPIILDLRARNAVLEAQVGRREKLRSARRFLSQMIPQRLRRTLGRLVCG